MDFRELALRHEEAHIDVFGRQDQNHRRHRRGVFSLAEIDVLHASRGARHDFALRKLIGAIGESGARLTFRGAVVTGFRQIVTLFAGGVRTQQALLTHQLFLG